MIETETKNATCASCGRLHQVDIETFNLFGVDCHCMQCVQWGHIDFMRDKGTEQGLSCIKGCRCNAEMKY